MPVHLAIDGIKRFLTDIFIQGPTFPYDSVCLLVSECLSVAAADITLSGCEFEAKAMMWLAKIWPEVNVAKSVENSSGPTRTRKHEPSGFDPEAANVLLSSISALTAFPRLGYSLVVPSCLIGEFFFNQESTRLIRDLVVHQTVPPSYNPEPISPAKLEESLKSLSSGVQRVMDLLPGSAMHHGISDTLTKGLEATIKKIVDTDSQELTSMSSSVLVVKSAIDIVIVGLLHESARRISGIRPNRDTLKACEKLLNALNQALEAHTWTAAQLATLISAYEPIIHPGLENNMRSLASRLSSPGLASGLPRRQLTSHGVAALTSTQLPSSLTVWQRLMPVVWTLSSGVQIELTNFTEVCEHILSSINSAPLITNTNLASTQVAESMVNFDEDGDEDSYESDFGTPSFPDNSYPGGIARPGKRRVKSGLGNFASKILTSSVAEACTRVLVTHACVISSESGASPVVVSSIHTLLKNCSGSSIGLIGIPIFGCIDAGLMKLSELQAEQLMNSVGENYLSTYEYSQDTLIQVFAIRLLRASLPYWAVVDAARKSKAEDHAWALVGHFFGLLFRTALNTEVQVELALLLNSYLEFDPSQENWRSEFALNLPKAFRNDMRLPIDILVKFLHDDDIRIRHLVAFLIPHAFELLHYKNISPETYWSQISSIPVTSEYEHMVTTSLCFVNTMIMSAEFRPRAYQKLVSHICENQDTPAQTLHSTTARVLLQFASRRLGFSSTNKLYELYAEHIAVEWHNSNQEPLRLQLEFLGQYPNRNSKLEATRSHLAAVGPLLILNDHVSAFQTCIRLAELSEAEAIRMFFPRVVGELIARTFSQARPGDTDRASEDVVLKTLKSILLRSQLDSKVVSVERDRVTSYLVLSIYASPSDAKNVLGVLSKDVVVQGVYKSLASKADGSFLTQPAAPWHPVQPIIRAIQWMDERYHIFTHPATVHSVIGDILCAISNSPFVNDQVRTLYSLSVYVALSHDVVSRSAPILTLLLQGCLPLLSEDSTIELTCPLVKWTIGNIFMLKGPRAGARKDDMDYEFIQQMIILSVERLVLVSKSGTGKSQDVSDARNLIQWLLDQVNKISSQTTHVQYALGQKLLLYWPEQLPLHSQPLALKDMLRYDSLKVTSAFKLVKHFVTCGLPMDRVESGKILFILLQSARHLRVNPKLDDSLGYFHLLSHNSGILIPPLLGQETFNEDNPRAGSFNSELEIIHHIFTLMIAHLTTQNLRHLSCLTQFIRRASACHDVSEVGGLPPDQISPLLFEKIKLIISPDLRRSHDLFKISHQNTPGLPSLIPLTDRPDQWTSELSKLLILKRLSSTTFFVQLIPVLTLDSSFASDVLPSIVHAYLLSSFTHKSERESAQKELSEHFCQLLLSPSTAGSIVKRILNVVTYLRSHYPPGKDLLGCDKWLRIPWLLLVKHATHLGMPASAFLFLEIGSEQGQISIPRTASDEDMHAVIHQLYSSAKEPDAFYSLPQHDPRDSLIQRYSHEDQWESAFGIHGAILEGAGSQSPHATSAITKIAHSLSCYGLNHLAYTILAKKSMNKDAYDHQILQGTSYETLPFESAWRASVWDLPQPQQTNTDSSTRLYGALKAIHHQRDRNTQTQIVDACIIAQFEELIGSSVDQNIPDPKSIGTAMALNDISSWLNDTGATAQMSTAIQDLLKLPQECE